MRIEYKRGNFLTGPEPVSCHGCNAQGRMGGSVASQIRDDHAPAYEAYLAAHARRGLRLGEVIFAMSGERLIANAITQRFYGNSAKTGIVYLNYQALAAAIRALDAAATGDAVDEGGGPVPGFDAVAFPLIGSGLAGGQWPRIAELIEAGATRFRPVVYTRDGRAPA